RIAELEIDPGKLEVRFRVLRVLPHGIAQLDLGGLEIALLQRLARVAQVVARIRQAGPQQSPPRDENPTQMSVAHGVAHSISSFDPAVVSGVAGSKPLVGSTSIPCNSINP